MAKGHSYEAEQERNRRYDLVIEAARRWRTARLRAINEGGLCWTDLADVEADLAQSIAVIDK
jgi:hypothetical protein